MNKLSKSQLKKLSYNSGGSIIGGCACCGGGLVGGKRASKCKGKNGEMLYNPNDTRYGTCAHGDVECHKNKRHNLACVAASKREAHGPSAWNQLVKLVSEAHFPGEPANKAAKQLKQERLQLENEGYDPDVAMVMVYQRYGVPLPARLSKLL